MEKKLSIDLFRNLSMTIAIKIEFSKFKRNLILVWYQNYYSEYKVQTFVFPGQGSQAIGMGKELYDAHRCAKDVFDEVDDALSQKLSQIIFNGTPEELTLTTNAQPALMAVSMAVIKVLEQEGKWSLKDHVQFVAGHSLGEYSALAAAKAISLRDTAQLLRIRGQSMQDAVPVNVGGMSAILGATLEQANEICQQAAQGQVCSIANDNCPGQVVISGHIEALKRAKEIAAEHGIKKVLPLPVSAPFHCSLMAPAAEKMREALDQVTFHEPIVPMIANVSAKTVTDPAEIKDNLVSQVTHQVRWTETTHHLKQSGVTKIIEIGAGKVLCGLTKRTDREIETQAIGTPQDIESFLI